MSTEVDVVLEVDTVIKMAMKNVYSDIRVDNSTGSRNRLKDSVVLVINFLRDGEVINDKERIFPLTVTRININ